MSSESDIDEEDVEKIQALIARRFHRGKEKFKDKLPIMCFNCNEVGHISTRCRENKNYRGGDKYKSRRDKDNKYYKVRVKKFCYITEEETKDGFDDHDDEVV